MSVNIRFWPAITWLATAVALLALTNCADADEPIQESAWVTSIRWLDDDTLLATTANGLLLSPARLVKIDAASPEKMQTVADSSCSLWSMAAWHDSVFVSDYQGHIARWQGDKLIQLERPNSRWIRVLACTAGENAALLAGTEDGQLIVIDPSSGQEQSRTSIAATAIFGIAVRPDQQQVAIAMGDGSVHLRLWPSLEPVQTLSGQLAVWAAAYTSDGQQLVAAGAERKLRLWNVASGQSVLSMATTRDWVTCIQPIPDSTLMIAGAMNGEVILLDYSTMLPVRSEKLSDSGVWQMAVSPNRQRLAIGTRKHGLKVIELQEWYSEATAAAAAVDRAPEPSRPVTQ